MLVGPTCTQQLFYVTSPCAVCFLIVQDLLAAGEKRFGTDESVFNSVLCSRSRSHIRAVNDEYFKLTAHKLEQAIDSEMSGDLRSGMIAIRKKQPHLCLQLHRFLFDA